MDRDDILKKAREEKKDEGLSYIEFKGLRLGYKFFCVLIVVLIVIDLWKRQSVFSNLALFWGFVAADLYSKYKFFKSRKYLINMIIAAMCCIGGIINYILDISIK